MDPADRDCRPAKFDEVTLLTRSLNHWRHYCLPRQIILITLTYFIEYDIEIFIYMKTF